MTITAPVGRDFPAQIATGEHGHCHIEDDHCYIEGEDKIIIDGPLVRFKKIKKLSETPVTVHNIGMKMTKTIKWPKITFPGSKMVPKVSKLGF